LGDGLLEEIYIPSHLKSIGGQCFHNCSNLKKVHIASIRSWLSIIFDAALTNPVYFSHKLYIDNQLVTSVEVPQDIYSIPNYAFYSCTDITNVTFHNDITSIGNYAFYGCTNASFNAIPSSITTIGEYAFYNCTVQQNLTIGNNSTIGGYAFAYAKGIY